MKKQRNILAVSLVVLAFVIIIGNPYFSSAEKADQGQQAKQADDGKAAASGSSAVKKAAENEKYELYIDEQTANIKVVNKTTKTEWLGAPQTDKTALPNEKSFVGSPVHIRYTEGADITQTYTLKDSDNKLAIKTNNNAVRAEFTLPKLKLSFAVEYRLREDGVEATIPYDSLKEEGKAKFVSLEVLPFFNAARETDSGAMFLPDGTGTIVPYTRIHPQYLKGYSEQIYGPDHAFITQNHDQIEQGFKHVKAPKEYVALPVFGNYRNNMGFLGIVTDGDTSAKINGTPPGVRNIALYRNSVEFTYRNDDVFFIGSSGKIPFYQGKMIAGDRKVRFVLLEGNDANYVGMAKAYRNYLIGEKGVKPVDENPSINVDVLGGILRDEVIGTTFISMTTFDQAKSIIDAYAAKDISHLELTFDGWSKDGIYGNQPDHFPVDKHLGGSGGLKSLVQYAKEKGISLYLNVNYVRPNESSDGFSKNKDAIRGIDHEVLVNTNYYVADGWSKNREKFYFLKPDRVFDNHISKEISDFAALGISGVHMQYMGDTLYSDQDPKHTADRKQTEDIWVKALDAFRSKVGKTAVDYGFAYTLGHVDRIDQIPVDNSHFVFADKPVPFYQIAIHGLVPYTAKPSNLRDNSQTEFLRALEYGALPSLKLTYKPTSDLQRTMENSLFSSMYEDWLDTSVTEYRKLQDVYSKIKDQPIINHEQLGEHLYRTSYGNGMQIIVNYDKQSLSIDGQTIPGLGYAVVGG